MSADLLDLKLKRRLLEQQLDIVDSRVARLHELRDKRKKPQGSSSNAEGATAEAEQRRQNLEQRRRDAVAERPIRNFDRTSPTKRKARQVAVRGAEPSPIRPGGNLDRIRKRDAVLRAKMKMEADALKKLRHRGDGPGKLQRSSAKLPPPMFVSRYSRGELPSLLEHRAGGYALSWVAPPASLDYGYYLPMYFEGLRCTRDPYKFVATQGTLELLEAAKGYPDRIIPSLEKLVGPLRAAMSSAVEEVDAVVMRTLQALVLSNPGVGEALVPYFRQLLLAFKKYYEGTERAGGAMDFKQRKGTTDITSLAAETLQLLEKTGGPDAFANIKWLIPTYQSCM